MNRSLECGIVRTSSGRKSTRWCWAAKFSSAVLSNRLRNDWITWIGKVPSTQTPPTISERLWTQLCIAQGSHETQARRPLGTLETIASASCIQRRTQRISPWAKTTTKSTPTTETFSTTADVYAHVNQQQIGAAMDKLDRAMGESR